MQGGAKGYSRDGTCHLNWVFIVFIHLGPLLVPSLLSQTLDHLHHVLEELARWCTVRAHVHSRKQWQAEDCNGCNRRACNRSHGG